MPERVSITVEQLSSATADAVYGAIMNLDRWPAFMPGLTAASWDVTGDPATGLGGVRRMRIGTGVTRDLIIEATRPHRQVYTAKLPWFQAILLTGYTGEIQVEDEPNGSGIVWTASCTPRVLGIRKLAARLERSYARLAEAFAEEAEHTEAR